MIGVAKTAIGGQVAPPPEYNAFITPSSYTVTSTNGGASSPVFTANVSGGVGPFTYLWSVTGDIGIASETSIDTSFSSSGYNTEKEGVITLTVTDEGNGNQESIDTGFITFLFGIQP